MRPIGCVNNYRVHNSGVLIKRCVSVCVWIWVRVRTCVRVCMRAVQGGETARVCVHVCISKGRLTHASCRVFCQTIPRSFACVPFQWSANYCVIVAINRAYRAPLCAFVAIRVTNVLSAHACNTVRGTARCHVDCPHPRPPLPRRHTRRDISFDTAHHSSAY